MEKIIETVPPLHVRLAKWCGAWLMIQTLLMGTVLWGISFQVLVRGASFKYEPPQEVVDYYYEPAKKK